MSTPDPAGIAPEQRIANALDYASHACTDGGHHKMWVIDQMVRALTGCPMVEKPGADVDGVPCTYEAQGESQEYREWIGAGWDEGTAP